MAAGGAPPQIQNMKSIWHHLYIAVYTFILHHGSLAAKKKQVAQKPPRGKKIIANPLQP